MADKVNAIDQILQVQLFHQYRRWHQEDGVEPDLRTVEFRSYSQHGEDGVLLYLFARCGFATRRVVEICAGDGIECNAANWIVNHGFKGLLFDGSDLNQYKADHFYRKHRNTFARRPVFRCTWITRENVNDLIREAGFSGEVDLFSLDVDGNDYWIWEALEVVSPRIVVAEVNARLGGAQALTMPYRPDYGHAVETGYGGASLKAFEVLGKRKGYSLVYLESHGVNAFLIRDDIKPASLPPVCAEEWLRHLNLPVEGLPDYLADHAWETVN
jgi:hypothetical protein